MLHNVSDVLECSMNGMLSPKARSNEKTLQLNFSLCIDVSHFKLVFIFQIGGCSYAVNMHATHILIDLMWQLNIFTVQFSSRRKPIRNLKKRALNVFILSLILLVIYFVTLKLQSICTSCRINSAD